MWQLKFSVIGEAVAWKRATPIGRGHVRKSTHNEGYQTQVKWSAKIAMQKAVLVTYSEALTADITFYFTPPESWPKYKQALALLNEIPCVIRKDADNLAKNILDGLNGLAFNDDHWVVDVTARRRWAAKPRADVILTAWLPTAAPQND